MPDITIRPSTKFVLAGAIALLALVAAIEIAFLLFLKDSGIPGWVPLLLIVVLAWPAAHYVRHRSEKTVLTGDRLSHQTGIASRSTQNVQLQRIQEVRVDQSMVQRIFGVGNISVGAAGEHTCLKLDDVDNPHQVAEQILAAAKKGTTAQ